MTDITNITGTHSPGLARASDGWYYFRDGVTKGPEAIGEIMAQGFQGSNGEAVLISRAGFVSWYPLEELASLVQSKESLTQTTRKALAALERHTFPGSDEIRPESATWSTNAAFKGEKEHAAQRVGATGHPQAASDKWAFEGTDGTTNEAGGLERTAPNPNKPLAEIDFSRPITITRSFWSHYLTMRGRLRLGYLRNPLTKGFGQLLATAGLYYYFWAKTLGYELIWHVTGQCEKGHLLPPFWLTLIPGGHLLMTYKLANLLQLAESRLHRPRTSPFLALILGLLPPLALVYLQSAANRYWRHAVQAALCKA